MERLYSNIKRRRKNLNMSQQELAEAVGYKGKSMIAQIENGKVDIPTSMITKFAEALNCSENDLIDDERHTAVTEPSIGYIPWPPGTTKDDDLDEESMEFAHLFQDASEEERALVMGFLKKKQPKP